jgi:hypothetical protein
MFSRLMYSTIAKSTSPPPRLFVETRNYSFILISLREPCSTVGPWFTLRLTKQRHQIQSDINRCCIETSWNRFHRPTVYFFTFLQQNPWTGTETKFTPHKRPLLENIAVANFRKKFSSYGARGSVVVNAPCYKPKGRGFETRSYQPLCPGIYSASNINEYQKQKHVSGE